MSVHLRDSEGFEPLQWDSFPSPLYQSNENIDISGLEFPGLDLSEFIEVSTQELSTSTTSAPSSLDTELRSTHDSRHKGQKTKRKGRPRSSLASGNESAIDRRRSQVRLAQQAYRHRKEERVASMKRDFDDLKKRLIGMERISDQLFEIASLPSIPKSARDAVESLNKAVQQYRLPPEMRDTLESTPQKATFPTTFAIMSNTSEVNFNSSCVDSSDAQLGDTQSPAQSSKAIRTTDNSPSNVSQNSPISLESLQLSIWHLAEFAKSSLNFAARLRYEALKGAYEQISEKETPYALLCRSFRYCIFSSTREQIKVHIYRLVHSSIKMTDEAAQTFELAKDIPSTRTLPLPASHELTEPGISDPGEPYISPEGVDQYLSEKGLMIDPNLPFAEFKVTPRVAGTLFEEMCRQEGIKINVSKLLYDLPANQLIELLKRMVCLVVGPGIRASEIDESLRLTILAEV
ncbi:hypothetical protein F5884DRAFT_750864 [Xylogone sp. PMI_703]|nr:hypothetical protein F5884DRAFT_750864 [Xylogone sp. PMI_703]